MVNIQKINTAVNNGYLFIYTFNHGKFYNCFFRRCNSFFGRCLARVHPSHARHNFVFKNYRKGLIMARLSYRGYSLSLKPLRTDNLWQLELEKSGGEIIHTYTIDPKKTLLEVEKFALDEVDKKIEEEKNSH